MTPTWPDLVIGALALVFALKGWKRGFVSELAGAVAFFIAIAAAIRYPGTLDDVVQNSTRLHAGAAHIVAMVCYALAVYLAIMALAWIFGRFAKLPVISLGNSAAGACVGLGKVIVAAWAVLYVALFFPLPNGVRGDLHRSLVVSIITEPNGQIDALMRGALPTFVQPFAQPIFINHRV